MKLTRTIAALPIGFLLTGSMLLGSMDAAAQDAPGNVQSNQGTGGFPGGPGIRLRSTEERGIKAGEFVLWPSLILEGRWNSNLFRNSTSEEPTDVPIIRIVPALAVSNGKPSKLGVQVGIGADVRLFVSDESAVSDQQGVGVTGDLRLAILPRSPVSLTIKDNFRRELDTRNFSTNETYNHNWNEAAARLSIHPGGGALNIGIEYAFIFDLFDDASSNNYFVHDFRFLTTWRFYPKTVALLEARVGLFDWSTEPYEATADAGSGIRVDNTPFRTYAGLSGFITKKLATHVKLGYGNSFHDAGPAFSHFIGQAEVSFKFTPTILAAVGYARDFSSTSFYGNYYTENRTYLRGQLRLARRVGIDLSAGYHLIDFAEFDPAQPGIFVSHKERRDQLVSGHAKVDVDITRWIGLTVGYEVRVNFTNFRVEETRQHQDGYFFTLTDYGRYAQHQVYGSVNVRY